MVLWCILVGAQLIFGFQISRFCVGSLFTIVALLGLSIPAGIGLSSLCYFALCWLFGHNVFHVVIHIVVLIAISIFLHRHNQKYTLRELIVSDFAMMVLFFIASRQIVYSSYFPNSHPMSLPETSVPYLYEEFAIKSSFNYGQNSGHFFPWNLKHPAKSGEAVVTKWLTAFHSSMLEM